jgi:hypothetical protein
MYNFMLGIQQYLMVGFGLIKDHIIWNVRCSYLSKICYIRGIKYMKIDLGNFCL